MKDSKKKQRESKLLELSSKLFLIMLFSLVSTLVFAQSKSIKGVVLDQDSQPIIGANILVEGTTNGTITDLDGNFALANVAPNAKMKVSYIGYITQIIPVSGKATFKIVLKEDAETLDEVVVVGYGVQKKSDVTGAMISVGAKELTERPVANAFEALQGKAAGVDITSNERPGELGTIRIRGVRTLDKDAQNPLYVVDGVPLMSSSGIETLNPRDIESIDILKDASATAIYGSRGANGVILVTTNRGKEGRFSLNYSGTLTLENIHDKAPMMNASDYITWRRWAYYNMNSEKYPRGDQPTMANDQDIFLATADPVAWSNIAKGWANGTWDGSKLTSTDWTDFVTQTGITHEHTISASGGSEKMNAYASFGYLSQDGTQKGQEYERYTAKMSMDLRPVKWFSLGGSINTTWSNQDYGMSTLGASSSSGPNSIYAAATRVFSYALPYDEEGNRVFNPGGDANVNTIIGEWDLSTQQRQTFRALGSFYAQLDLGEIYPLLNGLRYRTNFGPDYRNWREGVYIDGSSVNRASAGVAGTNYARLKNQRDFSWTLDNMITYDKTIGKHTVGLTLLQTASDWNQEYSAMNAQNIARPDYLWNAFGTVDLTDASTKAGMSSGITKRQLTSYMVRLNYTFNNRYMLTTSGRWDGASQLSDGHKWDFFSSVALGWRMDQEEFMKDIEWINQLKLRLGYGSTGNAAVDPYKTLGSIQSFYVPFGGASNTQGYSTYEPNYTSKAFAMANKDLGWEITKQYNFGIDFSFWNGRLGGTLDLYSSKTTNLLMDTSIPTLTGYSTTTANIGETKNKGFDLSLNSVNIETKGFQWTTNANIAYQKDEIVSLAYGKNDMISNGWFIGKSISVIYGIDGDGLWQASDAEEMAKFNANGHDFEVGMAKPVDQNGDHKIDANDRVIIGNKNPRWTLGVNNTLTYKGFELSCMLYGRFGYKVSTNGESQLGRYNQRAISYWTPDNTNADYQKPIYNEAGGDAYAAVLGYKSGSFLKIRTISFGYNFSKKLATKMGLGNLKIYAQAKNPGSIYSAIPWLDMDLGGSTYNRGFVFGLNVGF